MRTSLRAVIREALSSQSGSGQDCLTLRMRISTDPSRSEPRLDINPGRFAVTSLHQALNAIGGTVIRTSAEASIPAYQIKKGDSFIAAPKDCMPRACNHCGAAGVRVSRPSAYFPELVRHR